jgi:hypothetical protein
MLYNTHILSLSVRIHSNFVVSNDDSYIFYFCIKVNIAGKYKVLDRIKNLQIIDFVLFIKNIIL